MYRNRLHDTNLSCFVYSNQGDVNGDGHIDLLVSQQGKYMVVVEVFVHVQQPNAH